MFHEIVSEMKNAFDAKQESLIESVGDRLKEIIDGMTPLPGMSYGNPPYIIDDGEQAFLVVDAEGNYRRLPPFFDLTDDAINEEYDVVYSIPVMDFEVIRFLPANPEFDFPSYTPKTEIRLNQEYGEKAVQMFEKYMASTLSLTRPHIARHLVRMQMQMQIEKTAGAEGISFEQMLDTPGMYADLNTMIRSWIYNSLVLLKIYIIRRKLDTLQPVQPVAGTKKMTGLTGFHKINRIT